jgi:hypothetical protein
MAGGQPNLRLEAITNSGRRPELPWEAAQPAKTVQTRPSRI